MTSTDTDRQPREILRTGEPIRKPWPDEVFIQGGTRFYRGGERHDECFVEINPPRTFMRAEASTVAEAESQLWDRYQHMNACEAAPEHGPFEARTYTNGAGFCTKCGTWFAKVLPVTATTEDEQAAEERFFNMLGENAPAAISDLLDDLDDRIAKEGNGDE